MGRSQEVVSESVRSSEKAAAQQQLYIVKVQFTVGPNQRVQEDKPDVSQIKPPTYILSEGDEESGGVE